ncbi:hypothetical protein PF005_g10741 [Phytophthora fragariae]|uniref:Uncharacterized protein n=1 Tax=Phytophthora fragariae TaxID=53985 RepID=A0A6A3Y4L1_9STRA|nr:hypothetical protein PF003_g24534 [Phytophthora fragariae]KAE8923285.1 hypothetical protein PF009_g26463 [Phytophthora fragariae]KAE8974426.1 hypothetical protein PF011_g24869 [Phytophthora fragariae]KAE9078817.1 hypothetical protein PF007_g23695 [Phytophthora fragariae]KAE9079883.1 hypothetical protein PF010_g22592 [Phytophthora fragariae]
MLNAPVNTVDASWTGVAVGSQIGQASIKGSLGFIMNATDVSGFSHRWESDAAVSPLTRPPPVNQDAANTLSGKSKAEVRRTLSNEEKRRSRECKVDGCVNYIINKGLCIRVA